MTESNSRKLELTILIANDGIYVTFVARSNERVFGEGFINRRYDSISIDISPFQEDKIIFDIPSLSDLTDVET